MLCRDVIRVSAQADALAVEVDDNRRSVGTTAAGCTSTGETRRLSEGEAGTSHPNRAHARVEMNPNGPSGEVCQTVDPCSRTIPEPRPQFVNETS
jgi:hypothetical protein